MASVRSDRGGGEQVPVALGLAQGLVLAGIRGLGLPSQLDPLGVQPIAQQSMLAHGDVDIGCFHKVIRCSVRLGGSAPQGWVPRVAPTRRGWATPLSRSELTQERANQMAALFVTAGGCSVIDKTLLPLSEEWRSLGELPRNANGRAPFAWPRLQPSQPCREPMLQTNTALATPSPLLAMAALSPPDALLSLKGGPQGLTDAEASVRPARLGANAVGERPDAALWRQGVQRLLEPLNVLLLVLSGVSVLSGNAESAAIIFLMVVLSLTLGLVQERRSGRAAAALRAMVHITASVLRPGQDARECPTEQLVPGDVLHLSAGDLVPADVRVLAARDFFVNEAALTGESVPAEKHAQSETPEAIAAGDVLVLRNVCFMGTNVASGTATVVVVLTGPRAVFGGITGAITGERVQTSFERGIHRFTWLILRFMAVMVPLVFLINGFGKGDWLQALLFATAVAVGLAPEMLPMLVTVNLAKGALALSRKKVIVKRLDAIQNLGAMDVLCTDKTGTLTQDRIILEKYLDLRGEPSDRVLDFAYLNSHYQSGLKNLLDLAVLRYAEVHDKVHAQGLYEKVDELPFDFQRRRMSVVLARGQKRLLICKGAVE